MTTEKWQAFLQLPVWPESRYIGLGSLVGQMRSKFPPPWDWDFDVLVRKRDRRKVFEFVCEGDVLNVSVGGRCRHVCARLDPNSPRTGILAWDFSKGTEACGQSLTEQDELST